MLALVPEAVKMSHSLTRLSFPPVASMNCGAPPLVSWKAGSATLSKHNVGLCHDTIHEKKIFLAYLLNPTLFNDHAILHRCSP